MSKFVRKDHTSVEKVDRAIYELEQYMQTATGGGSREKENIRELKFLQDSKQYVDELQGLQQEIKHLKSEKYVEGGDLNELKEKQRSLQEEIDKLRRGESVIQNDKASLQMQVDKLKLDREDMRRELADLKQQKSKETEQFYKSFMEYEIQQKEVRTIKWIMKMKERLIEKKDMQYSNQ